MLRAYCLALDTMRTVANARPESRIRRVAAARHLNRTAAECLEAHAPGSSPAEVVLGVLAGCVRQAQADVSGRLREFGRTPEYPTRGKPPGGQARLAILS
jgi:hypothetical protein